MKTRSTPSLDGMETFATWRDALVELATSIRLESFASPRWALSVDGLTVKAEAPRCGTHLHLEVPLTKPTWRQLAVLDRRRLLPTPSTAATLDLGDPGLAHALVLGPLEAHGLFDEPSRTTWRSLLDAGASIEGGVLHLCTARAPADSAHATLRRFFFEARRLDSLTLERARQRLFEIAEEDPNPTVRARYARLCAEPSMAPYAAARQLPDPEQALGDAHSARQLLSLATHADKAVANRARNALTLALSRHSLPPGVLAELSEPRHLELVIQTKGAAKALLHGLHARFAARSLPPSEAPVARYVARYLLNRLNPTLALGPARPKDGTPSTGELLLTLIATHRETRDLDGLDLIRRLTEHGVPEIRRAALAALMDLEQPGNPSPAAHLADDYAAAALDGPPRHAVAHLVRFIHRTLEVEPRVTLIRALARIATVHEVPFLLDLVDKQPEPIIIAALGALGEIAPPSALPRLESLASGIFRDRDIKNAARAAAEQVRARGAGRGALSMAADGGGLSLDEPPGDRRE